MTIQELITSLQGYIGLNWDDQANIIEPLFDAAGFSYRWLTPTDGVNLNEFRLDRVNILVDANHVITGYTVG